jgi:hypothetical protein
MGTSLAFSYIAESPPPKAPVAGQGAGGAPRRPASGMEARRAETRMNDLFSCANGRRLTYKALIG